MKGKPILHIRYEYQLNIYLTVDSVVKQSQKGTKSPISQYAILTQLMFEYVKDYLSGTILRDLLAKTKTTPTPHLTPNVIY